jgi:hypothetical protein
MRIRCLLLLPIIVAMVLPSSASASWGPVSPRCSVGENHHCYALSERNIKQFGGVLSSIDFVDTTNADSFDEFSNEEEWISWPGVESGWLETGQAAGSPYSCCEMHSFFAEMTGTGTYSEYVASSTVPLNTYNHYVLYDGEANGTYGVYWGCCEVYKFFKRPAYIYEQEAGIEVATEARPRQWGRDEVAASDGGEWTAWNGAKTFRSHGICMEPNKESPAEGNEMWGTLGAPPNEECD